MHYHRAVILPDKSSVLLKASRTQPQLIFSSKSITEITYKHWKYTSDIHPLSPINKSNVQQITVKYWDWSPNSLKATPYLLPTHAHTVGGHLPFKLPKPFTGLRVQSREVSLSRHLTGWNKLLCILGNWVLQNISANLNTGWVIIIWNAWDQNVSDFRFFFFKF